MRRSKSLVLVTAAVVIAVVVFVYLAMQPYDYTRARGVAAFEQIRNLDPAGGRPFWLDSADAKITLLSQVNGEWVVRIDDIVYYSRDPDATFQSLKEDEIVNVAILGFIESYAETGYEVGKHCSLRPRSLAANASRGLPTLIRGDLWLAKLISCNLGAHPRCLRDGWSAYLYNPELVTLEYECQ